MIPAHLPWLCVIVSGTLYLPYEESLPTSLLSPPPTLYNQFAQWIFPDSSEGERKFLVRTDFGSGGGAGESRRDRRHYNRQGSGENSPPRRHASGNKDKLFLLVELTCTVQTHKDGSAAAAEDDGYGGLSGGGARGSGWGKGNRNDEGGGVRGPLKNFRAGSPRRRKKGKHGDSEYSGGDSSEGEDDLDGSDYLEVMDD